MGVYPSGSTASVTLSWPLARRLARRRVRFPFSWPVHLTRASHSDPPALVIFPTVLGEYVLAYRATMRDRHTWFVDAHSGVIVHSESEVDEQSAVGVGAGIQGQRKKVSSSLAGGSFQAYDRLRPAVVASGIPARLRGPSAAP